MNLKQKTGKDLCCSINVWLDRLTKIRSGVVFCLVVIGLLATCDAQTPTQKPVAEQTEPSAPKVAFKEEVYGDREIYDQPRLQFLWQSPTNPNKRKEIFSVKIDGSDFRRAASDELIYPGGVGSLYNRPMRSPDNRYIVYDVSMPDVQRKLLIDLKTQTRTEIARGWGVPHFQWTPDSKKILMHLSGEFVEYDMVEKKIKKRPSLDSSGFYITNGGKEILVITYDGFKVHDIDGKLLRDNVKLGVRMQKFHEASRDGKYLLYSLGPNSKVIATEKPTEILFTGSGYVSMGVFGPNNKYIYYQGSGIHRLDIGMKKSIKLFTPPEDIVVEISIFNF